MFQARATQAIAQFQDWSVILYMLLVTGVAVVVANVVWPPPLPKTAPKLAREGYPVLGMLRFFSARRDFYCDAVTSSRSGHFSFYFGKHQIVGVSGLEGRKLFYESKDLNMGEGYGPFFPAIPSVNGTSKPGQTGSSFSNWSSKIITTWMRNDHLVKKLPLLLRDARGRLDCLVAAAAWNAGIMDPFDDIYRATYHLTMRMLGADDIARSPELLDRSLVLCEQIEASRSPARTIFPWLPTLAHLRRKAAAVRLYAIFNKIVQERKTNGTRGDDALQYLLDNCNDVDEDKIIMFTLDTLFVAHFNSAINAAWMFVYLSCNTEWYNIVQNEVDGAVASYRTSAAQSTADVLASLTLDEWEAEFPMLALCQRECIRLQLTGTGFRKNLSGRDLPVGNRGEVIPADAFVVYLIDNIHMDPSVYTNPERWDPGRYLPDRAEDKKRPLSWLGWGFGRNPCLGMRFAKLESAIISAMLVAMFDYQLVHIDGTKIQVAPCTDRNNHAASKPNIPVRLQYNVRQHGLR